MSGRIPVENFINRIKNQRDAGNISKEQAKMLIADAKQTAGKDGNLTSRERDGLVADLKVDKEYYAQTQNPSPPPPPPEIPDVFIPTPDTNLPDTPPFKFRIPKSTPPPPPVPQSTWDTKVTYTAPTGIKQASPDIIVFDEEIDPEFLVQAFFQEFGGTELINISRYDLINGDDVSYSPIINLSSLRQSFNPNNIIGIGAFQENPTKYGIDLFSRGVVEPYFNDDGDLVVEINDVRPDESIEIEIASDGTINRIEL